MIANAGKVDRSIVTNNHRKNHRLSLRVLLPVSMFILRTSIRHGKNCPAHKSGVNSGIGAKINQIAPFQVPKIDRCASRGLRSMLLRSTTNN